MKVACLLAAGLALASSVGVNAVSDSKQNDIDALNYALQLEYLESAFYAKGLAQYDIDAFRNANPSIPTAVRDYMVLIGAHEAAHVTALRSTITGSAYSGQAGDACPSYSFTSSGFDSVNEFVANAIALEDVGVAAYTAALNHITNKDVQQTAATIATIEARHAAYLRNAAGVTASGNTEATNVPFPDATNQALLPADVLPRAAPFLTSSCTYNISAHVPDVRPDGTKLSGGSDVSKATASSANPQQSPAPTYTQNEFNADMGVLKYALTLEYLEADFYQTFLTRFNAGDFGAVSTAAPNSGASILSNVQLIAAHEVAHVQALQGLLSARGQTVPQPGCYNWSSITTATQFLAVADLLENTGVSAYDGAANQITDTGLQQIAASVAVVEARHAAYLNNLNGKNATNQEYMSGVLDQPIVPDDIVKTVQGLSYVTGALTDCANNRANTGSAQSFAFFSSASSSSTGSTRPNDNNNAASFAVPAFATVALAAMAALLF